MEAAIQFQILGRKAEYVGILRRGSDPPQSLIQVVAVVEEGPASSVRQYGQHIGVSGSGRDRIKGFPSCDQRVERGLLGDIARRTGHVEAARVDRADDGLGMESTLND